MLETRLALAARSNMTSLCIYSSVKRQSSRNILTFMYSFTLTVLHYIWLRVIFHDNKPESVKIHFRNELQRIQINIARSLQTSLLIVCLIYHRQAKHGHRLELLAMFEMAEPSSNQNYKAAPGNSFNWSVNR